MSATSTSDTVFFASNSVRSGCGDTHVALPSATSATFGTCAYCDASAPVWSQVMLWAPVSVVVPVKVSSVTVGVKR
ncbi:hypothetical protein DIPPA_30496 [Diplonema papillatum]|nr:hypothetical protein DIPPA_21897 [Diplonema papillatum]KAJ9439159.1 hypothetical protein DIPPA_30496 [Diplonema papillatum]